MDRKHFVLMNDDVRHRCANYIFREAPHGYHVVVSEPTRTLDQNAAQFPILEAFSKQLTIPVNGESVHMDPYDWKDVLTAIYKGEQMRFAQWYDGRTILLGHRTREFSKAEFSEWLDFLHATAAERGVKLETK